MEGVYLEPSVTLVGTTLSDLQTLLVTGLGAGSLPPAAVEFPS